MEVSMLGNLFPTLNNSVFYCSSIWVGNERSRRQCQKWDISLLMLLWKDVRIYIWT